MMYGSCSPLLASALAALEREAEENPDAAHLLALIQVLPWSPWVRLDVLNNFPGSVRSRPALMAVLLKELSAAFPVPMSLLH